MIDYFRNIFVVFRVKPSQLGVHDDIAESMSSLAIQHDEDIKRTKRAPVDWAVMFDTRMQEAPPEQQIKGGS